jgi:hypothetical protein
VCPSGANATASTALWWPIKGVGSPAFFGPGFY